MTAIATKTFHLGDILTVTTGRLVSPRYIEGVYDILGWMTGESLMTHQLPRAAGECEGSLRAQHPDLIAVVVPEKFGGDEEGSAKGAVAFWLAEQVAIFGETREVAPLAAGEHTHIDPIAEMLMTKPAAEIIAVAVPDEMPGDQS
jgi:hypothetical protein